VSADGHTELIDAHAHLQSHEFAPDRDQVLRRAHQAGIQAIVCSSDDVNSSATAVALAEREPSVWATVGVHPHEAATYDERAEARLSALATSARVVAIGEIGLDYYRDRSPRPAQRAAFTRQLALAERLGLPVVIHSREAAEDTYTILCAWNRSHTGPPGQMHCFGYDVGWAERFLQLGFMISIPGTVTYRNAAATREVARVVPEDRLTVETDCPYLAPQSRRGTRNEPSYLTETIGKIAELRGVAALHLGGVTAGNARRMFGLERSAGGLKEQP
jgi:TatD DNase family protein